ncbi:Na+/H+ antiporter [Curtobacterium sp. ISL-83]|uniref:Na+/H+ antiporter n=1 Tax=Curtobacterium sp. ISL-83 TaxID=2819145 RepID=UPI001BE6A57E|nr:Na+/H+ antiporter [Curtobacterium sp. ISL-83]MBT2501053.1 Na+/H+ antiporter [Curtobacterium sp. ISL-83]
MLGPELVVVLGIAIALTTAVARRLRVAPPVLLLVIGALLAFIPQFARVQLPADAVLLLFLPALLYWESLTTSLREIRKNLRGIVLMGTLLVVVTAGGVAVLLHVMGMPWGPAWVLGAAVAPTDATAVGVLTKMLPRRNVTVLRAESLVNDGTTLVVYGIAVAVTTGAQHLTFWNVSGMLALSYLGGIAAGLLAAWLGTVVLRRVDTVVLENLVTLLVPFVAFLGAEAIGASGVLAVVAAGIVISQVGPKLDRAETRQQVRAFWSFLTFLLNGSLFVLVGIEAMIAARTLHASDIFRGLGVVVAVSVALVLLRFAFLNAAGGTVWLVTRRTGGAPREGHRDRLVSGFAGFRGAVSLAMAVAVPRTLESGAPFPDRDLIIFVTAGVVVLTIVGQSIVLPLVLRRAALPEDESVAEERRHAERTAIEEALAALPRLARSTGADRATVARLRKDYEAHLDVIEARAEDDDDHPALQRHDNAVALELALVQHKAATLLRLRDEDEIDDLVLRQIRAGYDAEEARLNGAVPL